MIKFLDEYNDKVAINNSLEVISYQDLILRISLLQQYYKKVGIKGGDQIGINIKDQTNFLLHYIALWNFGVTIVLFDQQIKSELFYRQLNIIELNWLITDKECNEFNLANNHENTFYYCINNKKNKLSTIYNNLNGFVILFTSGTENTPKPVVLRKNAILNNIKKVIEYTHLTSKDSTILTLPLSYSYAMSQCLSHLIVGGTIHFIQFGFLPELIIQKISEAKVTNFAATPYFYEILSSKIVEGNLDISLFNDLRFLMNAGGFINPSTIQHIVNHMYNVKFYNNYGQTEASPRLSFACFTKNSKNYHGVGKPILGVEIFTDVPIGQVGKVYYYSEDSMLGYYKDVVANKISENRLVKLETGDIGKITSDGELVLMGRSDDMIKLNGRKFYLLHIQNKIQQIPNVKHVKLIKKRHQQYGEYLEAFIVPIVYMDGTEELARVKAFMKKILQNHEMPKSIKIIKEVNLTSNGKINKKDLEVSNELYASC